MNADITRNGMMVAANIDVDVHVTKKNGLVEWSGSFSLPHGIQFDDDEYTLKLANGRSGQILITGQGITSGSPTKRARFQGTGSLQ